MYTTYVLTYTTGGFSGTNTLIIEAPLGWGERETELVDALVNGTGYMEESEAREIVQNHSYYLIHAEDVDYHAS